MKEGTLGCRGSSIVWLSTRTHVFRPPFAKFKPVQRI